MYFMVRKCCCQLETFIKIVGIILTTVYFLFGLGGVVLFIFNNIYQSEVTERPVVDVVVEVSDLSIDVTDLTTAVLGKEPDIRRWFAILGGVLVTSFVGVVTNLLLVVGVKIEQRFLLLPWLLYHVIFILTCLGGGIYIALHFTVLTDHKDYLKAVIALFPLVFGIFFIFIWIMVDQLFVNFRYKQRIEIAIASRRSSMVSIHQQKVDPLTKYSTDSIRSHHSARSNRSTRSNRSVKSNRSGRSVKRARSARSLRAIKRSQFRNKNNSGNKKSYIVGELPYKLANDQRSQSFDQILESSASSSSGGGTTDTNWTRAGSRTLPRKLGEEGRTRSQATDTMRSTRSLASAKNVTIHPDVTEYHYNHFLHRNHNNDGLERRFHSNDVLDRNHHESDLLVRNQHMSEIHQKHYSSDVLDKYEIYPYSDRNMEQQCEVYPAKFVTLPRQKKETLEASVTFEEEEEDKINNMAKSKTEHRREIETKRNKISPERSSDNGETEIVPQIPSPVYPTLPLNKDWKTKLSPKSKGLTKDQIIGFYCTVPDGVML